MDGPITRMTLLNRLHDSSDEAAWREFVSLYGPLVYQLSRRRGLRPELAEQITQLMCVRVARALPSFSYDRHRGGFRKWVFTIALNEIRRHQRDRLAQARLMERYKESRLPLAGGDNSAEQWWDEQHARRLLQLSLDRLQAEVTSEKYAIFSQVAIEGVPSAEVAAKYAVTRQQVALLKCRLMKRLQAIALQVQADWGD